MEISRRQFTSSLLSLFTAGCIPNIPCLFCDEPEIYWDIRKGSGKIPVVLRHELAGNHETMNPFAEYFNGRGHSTFSADAPGHANSGSYLRGSYTLPRIVNTIENSLSQYRVRERIGVGYSIGALETLLAAQLHPNLYKGLVIIGGADDATQAAPTFLATLREKMEAYSQERETHTQERRIIIGEHNLDSDALRGLLPNIISFNIDVSNLNIPVVCIGSDRDEFFPKQVQERFVEQLPRVRYLCLENVDHGLPFSHADEIIRFISENYGFLMQDIITVPSY